ncbi:hypothetical protein J6590_067897 [Homalodisca vitripennis]|nr:hypothetical protein J6590_067897 [Homalodisca vitripennis]
MAAPRSPRAHVWSPSITSQGFNKNNLPKADNNSDSSKPTPSTESGVKQPWLTIVSPVTQQKVSESSLIVVNVRTRYLNTTAPKPLTGTPLTDRVTTADKSQTCLLTPQNLPKDNMSSNSHSNSYFSTKNRSHSWILHFT